MYFRSAVNHKIATPTMLFSPLTIRAIVHRPVNIFLHKFSDNTCSFIYWLVNLPARQIVPIDFSFSYRGTTHISMNFLTVNKITDNGSVGKNHVIFVPVP